MPSSGQRVCGVVCGDIMDNNYDGDLDTMCEFQCPLAGRGSVEQIGPAGSRYSGTLSFNAL